VEEITKILETGVPVIPVSNLFPWALWQLRGGIELQLFSIDPGWRLRFGGKSVDEARIWYRVLKYIARKLRFFN
jgi:hypothetical protein